MRFNLLKSRVKSGYQTVIRPPKIWQLPKKSEILIYDACGAEYLTPYLSGYRIEIIPVRRESVNVPILIRSIFTLDFWRGKKQVYIDAFIREVSPKLIITFIDNSIDFYTISNRFPNIRTIFIQNGSRSEIGDIFGHLVQSDDYHVDYMLVHGAAIGRHYQKYISGKTIVIGSFKNNTIKSFVDVADESILFISQFIDKPKNNEPLWIENDDVRIYWDQVIRSEVRALKFLSKWCTENRKLLRICGRGIDEQGLEQRFYADILKDCTWEYIPRPDKFGSYKLVDNAEIVVFIDSTLGYESLGRGNKTASFSCRGVSLNNDATKFGWPADLPDNGPFWTNEANEIEFHRVMDYLSKVSDKDWGQTLQSYLPELMTYDPGNSQFINLMHELVS
jgi:surface carbohydrate biosynthesis protein